MNENFKKHLSGKYPNLDIEKIDALFEDEIENVFGVKTIELFDEKYLVEEQKQAIPSLPVNSDLVKAILFSVLNSYLESK